MNKKFINIKTIYITLLILFSFSFNYYYANLGVFPIDTFAFFDTGYNILQDRHPFQDLGNYWAFSRLFTIFIL